MFDCKVCNGRYPVDDAEVLFSDYKNGICLACFNRELRVPGAIRHMNGQLIRDINSISVINTL